MASKKDNGKITHEQEQTLRSVCESIYQKDNSVTVQELMKEVLKKNEVSGFWKFITLPVIYKIYNDLRKSTELAVHPPKSSNEPSGKQAALSIVKANTSISAEELMAGLALRGFTTSITQAQGLISWALSELAVSPKLPTPVVVKKAPVVKQAPVEKPSSAVKPAPVAKSTSVVKPAPIAKPVTATEPEVQKPLTSPDSVISPSQEQIIEALVAMGLELKRLRQVNAEEVATNGKLRERIEHLAKDNAELRDALAKYNSDKINLEMAQGGSEDSLTGKRGH